MTEVTHYGGISTRLAVTTSIWCGCARMAVNWWNSVGTVSFRTRWSLTEVFGWMWLAREDWLTCFLSSSWATCRSQPAKGVFDYRAQKSGRAELPLWPHFRDRGRQPLHQSCIHVNRLLLRQPMA
jgi:hypothetical protein